MKVSAVTSLYTPHVGGVETMTDEMTTALGEHGIDRDIITKRFPDTLPAHEVIHDVNVWRITPPTDAEEILDLAHDLARDDGLFAETDVMHFVGMRRPLPLPLAIAANLRGIPSIGQVAGSEVPNPGSPEDDYIWEGGASYMPDAFGNVHPLVAVSSSTARLTEHALGYQPGSVGFLPAGINTAEYEAIAPFKPEGVDRFILSLRRLELSKGIHVLIDTYVDLVLERRIPQDTVLVIAGEGSQSDELREQAARSPIDPELIRFIGTVPLDQGIGMLKTADATVVPSLAEGGGLVNAEANAVGCPLIASGAGGIRDYTSERAARLVKPGSASDLSDAIADLYSDPEGTRRRVEAGREEAAQLDWNVLIERYIKMYHSAIEQGVQPLRLTTALGKAVANTGRERA